jgi:hypothetical protein
MLVLPSATILVARRQVPTNTEFTTARIAQPKEGNALEKGLRHRLACSLDVITLHHRNSVALGAAVSPLLSAAAIYIYLIYTYIYIR